MTAEIPLEVVELFPALLPVALALVETARQYRTTGRFRLTSLPLRSIKRLAYEIRRVFFTVSRNRDKSHLPTILSDFKQTVGGQSYELEWPLSFRYEGEDLNARRYYYDPESEYPHRQVHIRAWDTGDGITIYAHDEPSPIQHPLAHVRGTTQTDVTDWVAKNVNSLTPRPVS